LLISCLHVVVALSVTGCSLSMSKEEKQKNILQAPSVQISVTQATDSQFFAIASWPSKYWWRCYGDAALDHLVEIALKGNPSIQAMYEKIQFAKNQAIIAKSKLFPLVYFDGSDEISHLSADGLYRNLNPDIPLNGQILNFGLSFSYEFDFWSKYRNLYRAALGKEKAAIAETAQVELITATALAQSYFALKTNLLRKELYEQLYQVRKEYFALQRLLLQKAISSKLPPLLSEEAVFEAQQLVYAIEQEIAMNKHVVNILAGLGPDEPIDLASALQPLPSQLVVPADLSIQLLSRRPDLMAQIWQVEALAYEVGSAKAEFWPDVSLTGLLGFQSLSWGTIFQWLSKTASATPAISLPIYTAGAIRANISAKTALFNEAVYQYNALLLQSFQQVADLLAIGQSIYGQKQQQELVVRNATARYDLTEIRLQKGIDNALTAYSFLEALIQQKLSDVMLLYQQYVVSITLTRALGGGYLSEVPS